MPPSPSQVALILGPNDLNPANFVYDGEALLMLNRAAAGRMDNMDIPFPALRLFRVC